MFTVPYTPLISSLQDTHSRCVCSVKYPVFLGRNIADLLFGTDVIMSHSFLLFARVITPDSTHA